MTVFYRDTDTCHEKDMGYVNELPNGSSSSLCLWNKCCKTPFFCGRGLPHLWLLESRDAFSYGNGFSYNKKGEMQGGCISSLNWMGVNCRLMTPPIQQCDRSTHENSTVQSASTGWRKRKKHNTKKICSWSITQMFEILELKRLYLWVCFKPSVTLDVSWS